MGLFIYHFDEDSQSISLIYYYYIKKFRIEPKVFSEPTLPLPNYNSFKFCNGWVTYIKNNKEILFKYGVELLTFAIKEHNLELIDDIFKKCLYYFKEDLGSNVMFLSIITSTMPLLNEYYPEYISRYSLETTMITDSPFYYIEHQDINLHLYPFRRYFHTIDISQSIWWLNYCALKKNDEVNNKENYFKIK
ncbi:hypothetical protein GLOIN_2v1580390, partial [Rhizophagus irregularis DAOM 181602=DAOM 197198]